MENFDGMDSDEEYDLDLQLLTGSNVEIKFALPELETCDPPKEE